MKTKNRHRVYKSCADKASNFYNTLLEIYASKFSRLGKNKKKNIAIKNRPEILNLKLFFSEDD